jgi:hypothetical protein
VTAHHCGRVSPFGHPRIIARLAAPRGISQPPTSFIGSWCQGIHRTPLFTYHNTQHSTLAKQNRTHNTNPDHPAHPAPPKRGRNTRKTATDTRRKMLYAHYATLKQHPQPRSHPHTRRPRPPPRKRGDTQRRATQHKRPPGRGTETEQPPETTRGCPLRTQQRAENHTPLKGREHQHGASPDRCDCLQVPLG